MVLREGVVGDTPSLTLGVRRGATVADYVIGLPWWMHSLWMVMIVCGTVLTYVWSRLVYLLVRQIGSRSEDERGDHE
jgi:hypothetical protein